jgi:hypothetical protein
VTPTQHDQVAISHKVIKILDMTGLTRARQCTGNKFAKGDI